MGILRRLLALIALSLLVAPVEPSAAACQPLTLISYTRGPAGATATAPTVCASRADSTHGPVSVITVTTPNTTREVQFSWYTTTDPADTEDPAWSVSGTYMTPINGTFTRSWYTRPDVKTFELVEWREGRRIGVGLWAWSVNDQQPEQHWLALPLLAL